MSEISELEVRLAESQKKLKEVQFEINAIQMELINLKGGGPVTAQQPPEGAMSPYRNLRPEGGVPSQDNRLCDLGYRRRRECHHRVCHHRVCHQAQDRE